MTDHLKTIREALSQLYTIEPTGLSTEDFTKLVDSRADIRTALDALEAAMKTPVAEVIQFDGEKIIDASMAFFDTYPIGTKLFAVPPAQQAQPTDDTILKERDEAEDFIDALLDEVLGADRPEWSSAYGRAEALAEVQERMTALHRPMVDKAWQRFEQAQVGAAPQDGQPTTPQAATIEDAARDVGKWLNERPNRELDLRSVAMLVAHAQQAQPSDLQRIEQYRMQMAGISTAAIGYWKEGDTIHPDYDTVALRDVAKLYAKYDELYRKQAQAEAVRWERKNDAGEWVGVPHGDEHFWAKHGSEMRTKAAPQQAEAVPQAAEFCWLVEHFDGDGTGNSTGHYYTGKIGVADRALTTMDANEAKRYDTWREANLASVKLGSTLTGTWRAVQHGFHSVPQQAEAVPLQPASEADMVVYRAIAAGYKKDTAPQQAEVVPLDVVRDAERWRTFLATRPANTHAVINDAIDAATAKGEKS